MRRIAAVFATVLLVAVIVGPASASSYSLGIGSPTLSKSRVVVTVPVQVTCPALDPAFTLVGQSITVDVQQSAGRQIAHGSASVHGYSPDHLLVACDGTPKTVNVAVRADPTGPPFRGGWMSVSATAEFSAGVEDFPGCGCGSIEIIEFFSAGPVDRPAK